MRGFLKLLYDENFKKDAPFSGVKKHYQSTPKDAPFSQGEFGACRKIAYTKFHVAIVAIKKSEKNFSKISAKTAHLFFVKT